MGVLIGAIAIVVLWAACGLMVYIAVHHYVSRRIAELQHDSTEHGTRVSSDPKLSDPHGDISER